MATALSEKAKKIIAEQGIVRIGDIAPDFTQASTKGEIDFYKYIDGKWAILFSHPAAHTPVCTTELAVVSKLKDEWAKRNTVVIGLSVDSDLCNAEWIKDIEEIGGGAEVFFPIICDEDYSVTKLYSMVNQDHVIGGMPVTARSVFFIGPDKRVKATLTYPAATGRNFKEILRVLDGLQLTAYHEVATPANWEKGAPVVVLPFISTEDAKKKFPKGLTVAKPYLRFTPDPSV